MEPVSFSEMLKQFGPYGICLFLMGSGLVYLMRWLREERKQTDITHEGIRNQFLTALKDQRTENLAAIKDQREEHSQSLKEVNETHKRIDTLSASVDRIDSHVQQLRSRDVHS